MDGLSSYQHIWLDWHPNIFYVLLQLIALYILWTYFQHGLSHVPGPILASVSPAWRLYAVWKEDMPRKSIALHRKYGPIVRIGPNHVSVSSPEAFHVVYSTKSAFTKVCIPTYKPACSLIEPPAPSRPSIQLASPRCMGNPCPISSPSEIVKFTPC